MADGDSQTVINMIDANHLNLIQTDTLACKTAIAIDGQGLVVAADTFIINGQTSFDTLAICICPAAIGGQERTVLWVTDVNRPMGSATVLIDSNFLDGGNRIHDAKYENHTLILSLQKGVALYSLSNLNDPRQIAAIALGSTIYGFAAFKGREGHLELVFPRRLDADLLAIYYYRLESK
jgi:hypothetical protein